MTNIVTQAEVKTILGISGASQDTLIDFHILSAQELLYDILSITDLYSYEITKELTRVYGCSYFYLKAFPVTAIGGVFNSNTHDEITGFSYQFDDLHRSKVFTVDGDGVPDLLRYKDIKVTYTAGYVLGTGEGVAENINIPNSLKTIVAYLVGGLMAENKKMGGITEYSLGTKTVKFASGNHGSEALKLIRPYLVNYKQPIISS